MDRAAKRELIDHLHGVLKDTGVVVVAHNTGLVAAQSAEFRRRVKDAGGSVKVAKNKLAQLALKDTDAEGISGLMTGPNDFGLLKGPDRRGEGSRHVCQGQRQARDPRRRDGQDHPRRERRESARRSAVA